jgi:hypothetical protein
VQAFNHILIRPRRTCVSNIDATADGNCAAKSARERAHLAREFAKNGQSPAVRSPGFYFGVDFAEFGRAEGSPVGGGAWSVWAGGPNNSVKIGFSASAHT